MQRTHFALGAPCTYTVITERVQINTSSEVLLRERGLYTSMRRCTTDVPRLLVFLAHGLAEVPHFPPPDLPIDDAALSVLGVAPRHCRSRRYHQDRFKETAIRGMPPPPLPAERER